MIDSDERSYAILYKQIKRDEEWIWFYYESFVSKKIKCLEIINTIFFDLNFNQKNMLILNYNNKEKGYIFNLKEKKHIINFNEF